MTTLQTTLFGVSLLVIGILLGKATITETKPLSVPIASIATTQKNACGNPKTSDSAKEILAKADALLQEGKTSEAGLYFANALQNNPEQWQLLYQYGKMIIDWSIKQRVAEHYMEATTALLELQALVKSRSMYLPAAELPQAIEKIANLEKLIQETKIQHLVYQVKQATQLLERGLEKNKYSNDATALEAFWMELITQRDQLIALETAKNSEIKLENMLEKLESRIKKIESNLQAITLLEQVNVYMDIVGKNIIADSNSHVLIAIQSAMQQLWILRAKVNNNYVLKIDDLEKKQKGLLDRISQYQSEVMWKREVAPIESEIATLSNTMQSSQNAQEAMKKLQDLSQFLAGSVVRLTDKQLLDKAKILLENIETAQKDWQQEQQKRYERWAIGTLVTFWNNNKNKLSMTKNLKDIMAFNSDETTQEVSTALIHEIGIIDVRYLSSPGATLYNEVFHKFYNALDDERKILTSSAMATRTKRNLAAY